MCLKEVDENCKPKEEVFFNEALVLESEFLEHQSKSCRKVSEIEWSKEVFLMGKEVEEARKNLEIL